MQIIADVYFDVYACTQKTFYHHLQFGFRILRREKLSTDLIYTEEKHEKA